jgi:antagonist of KipI
VGPTLRFHQDVTLAIAAGSCNYSLNGKAVPEYCGFRAHDGTELKFGNMKGWFGYLAVGGGFQADPVLNSVSTYVQGHIGKRIENGMILQIGEAESELLRISSAELEISAAEPLPIIPALHTSNFSVADREKIASEEYEITFQSNRMGIRLKGENLSPPVVHRSAPVLPGTLQVPESGQPILLGPDGPTTGGYAQLAVIARVAWTTLASIAPGNAIRFRWITPYEARALYRRRNSRLKEPNLWTRPG